MHTLYNEPLNNGLFMFIYKICNMVLSIYIYKLTTNILFDIYIFPIVVELNMAVLDYTYIHISSSFQLSII